MSIIGIVLAVAVLTAVISQLAVFNALSKRYGAVTEALSELRSELKAATESVREAGQRAEDRFSADVSELLNYNYLK
jgi:hypothetical protein